LGYESALPAYGASNLGAINLTQFRATAAIATRRLDNVYEVSGFPLASQAQVARASRRIGLGLSGLADAFIMLGLFYGSERSLKIAGEVMQAICHSAYRASVGLAREKGVFPRFRAADYIAGVFIRTLPQDIRDAIRATGIRNSHLAAIALAGSISLLADNVSSGLEPVYRFQYRAAFGRRMAQSTRFRRSITRTQGIASFTATTHSCRQPS
jgi:ribonucleoside-diphosphate reductase alpha chain